MTTELMCLFWLMMLWHWKITSIMRKSSLQFWWCLLVCFIYKYAEYQHYKCHCQKTRLCTTGSYRYDKIAVCEKVQQSESFIYLVGSFIGSCILGIPIGLLLCTQISKIPGLSYFEYHFPVLFVLLYFAAVVMVYHVVSVYQKKSLQQHSIIERIRTIG